MCIVIEPSCGEKFLQENIGTIVLTMNSICLIFSLIGQVPFWGNNKWTSLGVERIKTKFHIAFNLGIRLCAQFKHFIFYIIFQISFACCRRPALFMEVANLQE